MVGTTRIKALALFSGGLDSTLSAKVIFDQGVEVEAVHFMSTFSSSYKDKQNLDFSLQTRQAKSLGIELHILDISQLHLTMVQAPSYGYGRNMNPCIDCRILMLKQAKAYIERQGFSFLISGEVLGQRPMSQRRDALDIIDRDAQVNGLVLRPLSARLLKPTLAEEKGWVDREKLFAFSGRSRKGQLALAKELGIKEYLTPAGGCLLTEEGFTRKLRDLFTAGAGSLEDIQLLKAGRHFRYPKSAKIIVGRNEEENKNLADWAKDKDLLLKVRDFSGPLSVILQDSPSFSDGSPSLIETAAQLTAHYSKAKDQDSVWVDYWPKSSGEKKSMLVCPAKEELVEKLRI